jgi:hypothetical protein
MWHRIVWCSAAFRKNVLPTPLKMETAHSSETAVGIYQTTWRYIPEDISFVFSFWYRLLPTCIRNVPNTMWALGSHNGAYEEFCVLRYNAV